MGRQKLGRDETSVNIDLYSNQAHHQPPGSIVCAVWRVAGGRARLRAADREPTADDERGLTCCRMLCAFAAHGGSGRVASGTRAVAGRTDREKARAGTDRVGSVHACRRSKLIKRPETVAHASGRNLVTFQTNMHAYIIQGRERRNYCNGLQNAIEIVINANVHRQFKC